MFFFDSKVVVDKDFVPQRQTVNAIYCIDVLETLRKRFIRTRKNISASWKLHHNKAPCHNRLLVREFRAKHQMRILPHPPCEGIFKLNLGS